MKKETGDRRRFLKQVAAAGVTAGLPALPKAAQETLAQLMHRQVRGVDDLVGQLADLLHLSSLGAQPFDDRPAIT